MAAASRKIDLGSKATTNIDFEAPFNYKPAEERQYLFDHVWRQVADKFYDPKDAGCGLGVLPQGI